jgi:hypothetical protein
VPLRDVQELHPTPILRNDADAQHAPNGRAVIGY